MKKTPIISGKFYSSNVEFDKESGSFVIKFPQEILKHIEFGNKVSWVVLNGTIQISSFDQPHLTIPMMSVIEDEFISYK